MNNIIIDITRHCITYLVMVKIFENAQRYLQRLAGLDSNKSAHEKLKSEDLIIKGVTKKKPHKTKDQEYNHFIINLHSLRENTVLDYSNSGCALQLDISEKHLEGCKHKTATAGTNYIGTAIYPYGYVNGKMASNIKNKRNKIKKDILEEKEALEEYENILKKISEINVDISKTDQDNLNPFYQNLEEFSMRFSKDAATNLSTAMMLTKSEEELYNI